MFICNKLTSPILSNNQTPRFITTKHRKFINSGTMIPNSHPTIIRLLKILFLLSRYRRRFKHDSLQFSAMIVDIILGNLMYRIHKNTQKNTCKWLNKFYHFYQKYKKSISLQSIMILLNNCIQNHLLVLKFMQFGWPQQKCSYNTFLLVCSLDPFLQRKTTSLSFVKSKSWGRSN